MTGLKDFQLGKDIMKDKLKGPDGLKLRTHFNSFLNSLEKHNLLMLLNSLGIKLLDILQLAIESPEPLKGIVGDNIWSDEQLSK